MDTIYTNMLFFPDGLVVTGFTGLNCGNCDIESNNQFLKNVSQNKQPETSLFYGNNWGIYIITDDTVKVQVVNSQSWPNPYWYLFEHWFLINADGSLSPIYSKNLIDNKILNENPIKPIYKFIKTKIQLPSDTWLKKEEWFWCDKEEYKAWKKENKK